MTPKNSQPRLAIIIPNYNYEKYIDRAIRSVVSQDISDCEVVVIDDGSTDASWSIIETWADINKFRVANGGALAACVHGIIRTSAPFILILDADDELAPGSIDVILRHLEPSIAKLQYSLTPIDSQGNVIGRQFPDIPDYRKKEALIEEILSSGSYATPPTSGNVFRRDLIQILPEIEYEKFVDGVPLFAAPFFGDVVNIKAALGFYRIHDKNYSQSGSRPSASRFQTEADRFIKRLTHLQLIIKRMGYDLSLPDPSTFPFYRERRIYQAIMEDRVWSSKDAVLLAIRILRSNSKFKNKLGTAANIMISILLPGSMAKKSLKYRMEQSERTTLGYAKSLFSRHI